MALFCIPRNLVEKLKESALKGEVDIKALYDMSSGERRDFFSKYTDETLGKFINTEFEKAVVSKQKTAMLDWAKSVFSPEAQQKPVYKNILDKINSLDELGVLNPKTADAFLEDLVTDKLGINVSAEEVKVISERAKSIEEAQTRLGSDLGNPAKTKENVEFFKAKKEMDDYLNSLNPASNVRVLTSVIGRGAMLASVKSPLINIISNFEVGVTEAITRRLVARGVKGTNSKLAADYIKMVNKVYQESGYDMSRMTSLSDSGVSGRRVLGNDTGQAQGSGAIRKVGRVFEDTIFKQLMGAPDVVFSATHFADSVNINALKMADGKVLEANQYMKDAMLIEPQSDQGKILRAQAILDAQVATWTNKTWASNIAEGVRTLLNDATGDLRAGDWVEPFVKTPANVIAVGMDYAGVGIPKALLKTYKAFKSGDLGTTEHMQSITRDLVRSGLGLTGALIIASQLKDDDFVGAYDPARAQIEGLRNSTTNAIRVGGKWISTDALGPLKVSVTAMMYARKYGAKGTGEKVFQYGTGVANAIKDVPGIKDVFDYTKSNAFKQNQSLEEMTGQTRDYILEQAYNRLVPSLASDIAKATDKYDRDTGGTKLGTIKNKIPGVRETLPIKKDIFGKPVEGESAIDDILFGSRVKTDKEDAIISEISRASKGADKDINFTDWAKTTSKTVVQFKEKVGPEKFEEARTKYGTELRKQLEDLFKKPSYQKLSDTDKARAISDQDTQAQEKILKQYHFKYKEDKKKKVSNL